MQKGKHDFLKRAKRRLLAGVLAAAMAFSVVPTNVFAIEDLASQKAESQTAETPKEETPKEETPKEETPKEETPKEETPKEETPKEETPKEETPKEETPKEETPKEETPKADPATAELALNAPVPAAAVATWAEVANKAVSTTDYEWNTDSTVVTIKTVTGLAWFANEMVKASPNNFAGKTVVLGDNINFDSGLVIGYDTSGTITPTNSWISIGNKTTPFAGTFDGNNKTVSGVKINNTNAAYQGLFGWIADTATVKDVGVVKSDITAKDYVGGVVGLNIGTVTNCNNAGTIIGTGTDPAVGGVVGSNNGGTVTSCNNTGAVNGTVTGPSIGGVVGYNLRGTVTSCNNSGAITGISDNVGGVVGLNNATVTNCNNTGTITGGDRAYAGGVVGKNNATVTSCNNIGAVNGTGSNANVGGVVGWNNSGTLTSCYNTGAIAGADTTTDIGGVVGWNNSGTLTSCYNTGAITGGAGADVGGVVGENYSTGIVTNCHNTGEVTGTGTSGNVGGMVGNNSGIIKNCYNIGTASGTNANVGGVVGNNSRTIKNCYNTCAVTGGKVGGVVGNSIGGTVTSCYYITGTVTSGIGGVADVEANTKGMAEAAMKHADFVKTLNKNLDTIADTTLYTWAAGATPPDVYPTLTTTLWVVQPATWADVAKNAKENTDYSVSVDTYTIKTVTGLAWFANEMVKASPNNFVGKTVVLGDNINLDSGLVVGYSGTVDATNSWIPIGNNTTKFAGIFDGAGHTVSGVKINNTSADYQGLFGVIESGAVKNVRVTNSEITAGDPIGGVVGFNKGTVTNCYSTSTVTGTGTSSTRSNVGGVVGWNKGTVTNCYSTGAVTVGGVGGAGGVVGGVVGVNTSGTVTNCYNTGAVNATGDGKGSAGGGVIGCNSGGTVKNCYNTGTVSASGANADVGGVVGLNTSGTVTNCYNTGAVSGANADVGGVVGENTSGTVTSCYYLSGTGKSGIGNIATDDNAKTKGMTAANMKAADFVKTLNNNLDTIADTTLYTWAAGATSDVYPTLTTTLWVVPPDTWEIVAAKAADGTDYSVVANTYTINTATGLAWFANEMVKASPNSFYGKTVVLGDNINLDSGLVIGYSGTVDATNSWIPIGNNTTKFMGTFDGAGHTVSGVKINNSTADDQGLFGAIGSGAIVKNVGVIKSDITAKNNVGGVVGWDSNSTVTNCYNTGTVTGSRHVGGVVGFSGYDEGSKVTNCYNTGAVKGTENVGGVVGYSGYALVKVTNCYNTGAVTATGNYAYVGGVVGENGGAVTNCYNTGVVNGTGSEPGVGGVVGDNVNNGKVTNCYNTGAVTATVRLARVGGVVGVSIGNVKNCYNTGAVTAIGAATGGVVGEKASGTVITSCYYITGTVTSGIGGVTPDVDAETLKMTEVAMKHADFVKTLNGNLEALNDTALYTWAAGATPTDVYPTLTTTLWVALPATWALAAAKAADGTDYSVSVDTYTIKTATGLAWFANEMVKAIPSDFAGKTVVLEGDIDLDIGLVSGYYSAVDVTNSWIPIGNTTTKFAGIFDGAGHTVSGVKIKNTSADYQGLFGYIAKGATVKNVGVVKSDITANDYVCGVVGYNGGTVTNCYNTGAVTASGTNASGGVVGYNNNIVTNCYNTGTITCDTDAKVGGVVGLGGKVKNCYNTGEVKGIDNVGGVVGLGGTVKNCYNTGNVSASGMNANVGGVVGNKYSGTVESCYYKDGTATSGIGGVTPDVDAETLKMTDAAMKHADFVKTLNDNLETLNDPALYRWMTGGTSSYPALTTTLWKAALNTWADVGKAAVDGTDYSIVGKTYTINTATGLAWVANEVAKIDKPNKFSEKTIVLAADINLNPEVELVKGYSGTVDGTNSWIPIGNSGNRFAGTFDGAGHTVSGVRIDVLGGHQGLFGFIEKVATVKNVGVINSSITGIGGASVGGVVGENFGTVKNCYSTGIFATSIATVGGVVGANFVGTVKNCYSTSTITGGKVGGVVGENHDRGTVTNCYYKDGTATSGIGGVTPDVDAETLKMTDAAMKHADFVTTLNANVQVLRDKTLYTWKAATPDGYPIFDTLWVATPLATWADVGKAAVENTDYVEDAGTSTYTIKTAAGLAWFANEVVRTDIPKTFEGKTVELADNINLDDGLVIGYSGTVDAANSWIPIGNDTTKFMGTFDGKNNTVSGVKIKNASANYQGLFGYIEKGATVKNVGVVTSDITAKAFVGGVVGTSSGTVTNCYNTSAVTCTGTDLIAYAGGVVGYNFAGTATNCYNTGVVKGTDNAGGVVGYNFGGTVKNCYNTSAVTGTDLNAYAGGVVGYNFGGTVTNCYNTGVVTGSNTSTYIGGVVGYNHINNKGKVNICYYLTGTAASGIGGVTPDVDANTKGMSEADMQAADFVTTLNANVQALRDKTLYTWQKVLSSYPTFDKFVELVPIAADFTFTAPTPLIYDGTAKTVRVAAKSGVTGMGAITVKYYNSTGTIKLDAAPKDAGTYKVKIDVKKGRDYLAATDLTDPSWIFTIEKKAVTDAMITAIPAQIYTGSAIAPTLTVKDGTIDLVTGTNYTVAYKDNINAGTATATVSGMGNYTGTATANFNITAKAVTNVTITAIPEQTYTGSAIEPTLTVKNGTTDLAKGTDYTVEYKDNINAGTATATVSGMGNYTGTATANFNITSKELTATITATSREYNGKTDVVLIGGTLDGVIANDTVNATMPTAGTIADANVGTKKAVTFAAITLTGNDAGNYSITQPKVTVDITSKELTATITATTRAYNGKTDATVTYSLTDVVGKEAVTATGTAAFDNKNVGIDKEVKATGITLGGADNANYSLTSATATCKANITAKELTVTGLTATPRAYNGTTEVTLTGGMLDGVITNDIVNATMPTAGTIADANVGTKKAVTFAEITLTGNDAGNYSITQPKVTVDITAIVPTMNNMIIYANGVPITIEAGTGTNTKIKYNDGTRDVYLKLKGGTIEADLSSYIIYGGACNMEVETTSITMIGGSVGNVYGGGDIGAVTGNTAVTVSGGTINKVYGGGFTDTATVGSTKVEISDSATVTYYVYGGGERGEVTGNTAVTVSGSANVTRNVYGGGDRGEVTGNTAVTASGGTVGNVYGGGLADTATAGSTKVEISGSATVTYDVYGGGERGEVTGNTAVIVSGGTVGNVYGGGAIGAVTGNTAVTASGGTINKVYGGGLVDTATVGSTKVEISDSANVTLNVYGGGGLGAVTGDKTGYVALAGKAQADTFTSLLHKTDTTNWEVMGSYTLANDFTITDGETLTVPSGATLTVPSGKTLTANGTLTGSGQLVNNGGTLKTTVFKAEDIQNISDKVYTGDVIALTPMVASTRTILSNAFTIDTSGYTSKYQKQDTGGNWVNVTETKDAGSYQIVYTNGKTTVAKTFEIAKKEITATIIATTREYNGKTDVVLTDGTLDGVITNDTVNATMPIKGTITDANIGNNKSVTFTAIALTGNDAGNYSITQPTVTVNIIAKTVTDAMIGEITNQTYTGSAIAPTPVVTDGSPSIITAADYTVSYEANTNVGTTAKVIIAGRGNYTGTATKTFTITAKELKNPTIGEITNQTYTGKEVKPALVVTDGTTELKIGTDYTVKYTGNTNAGTATATVTLTGNYSGTATKTFTITAKELKNPTIGEITNQTYTGKEVKPVLVVTDGTTELKLGTDYTVKYTDNINAGTAKATVTLKGNYSGTATKTFTITAKELKNPTIGEIGDQKYTGKEVKPALVVTDGETVLTLKTDYTVEYKDNIKAGKATATVTLTGNYSGTATKTFTITAKELKNPTIGEITNQTYTGKEVKPALVVTDGTTELKIGTDYTVKYTGNTNAGKATATVTLTGNYSGTATKTFTITAKELKTPTIYAILDQTYTGKAITPILTVKDGTTTLAKDTDYTVKYTDNTNAGTATATVTLKGNYSGTATKTFTITAKELKNPTIGEIGDQKYTGKEVKPALVVTDGETVLTLKTDYTVEYKDNIKAGKATATVTLKGNYSGTATASFNITKDPIKLTDVMIEKIPNQKYTGSAIESTLTVKNGNTALKLGTDYTVAYKDNINAGTATATVSGMGDYTGTATKTFTITKADGTQVKDYAVPTVRKAITNVSPKLSNVTLDGKGEGIWTWSADKDLTADNKNKEQTFKATFTPTDSKNYSTVEVDVKVSVSKLSIAIDGSKLRTLTKGTKEALTNHVTVVGAPLIEGTDYNTELTVGKDNIVSVLNNEITANNVGVVKVTVDVMVGTNKVASVYIVAKVESKNDDEHSKNTADEIKDLINDVLNEENPSKELVDAVADATIKMDSKEKEKLDDETVKKLDKLFADENPELKVLAPKIEKKDGIENGVSGVDATGVALAAGLTSDKIKKGDTVQIKLEQVPPTVIPEGRKAQMQFELTLLVNGKKAPLNSPLVIDIQLDKNMKTDGLEIAHKHDDGTINILTEGEKLTAKNFIINKETKVLTMRATSFSTFTFTTAVEKPADPIPSKPADPIPSKPESSASSSTSSTSSTTSTTSKPSTPSTGDSTPLGAMAGVIMLGLVSIAGLVWKKKNR